ncbi:MAG: hypothetical protein WB760_24040 [Xanthobacteraceae bacterium]
MPQLSHSTRYAVMIDLIKRLRAKGSWCGETHIQKAAFILQQISKSKLGYKFVLYKHGPYSFELKDELTAMKASEIIEFTFPQQGYGPSIKPTRFGERLYEVNKAEVGKYAKISDFVANWFGSNDVRYLERIATAYFVSCKHIREPVISRAQRLVTLKPHVDLVTAEEAVRIVDQKREEARMIEGQAA